MNTKIIAVIGVVVIGIIIFVRFWPSDQSPSPSVGSQALAEQTRQANAVMIVVTPLNVSPSTSVWQFKTVLDTHVDDLNQDIAANVVLIGNDKQQQPLGWQGDPPGGHHREGILEFQSMTPRPRSIELRINGIGGETGTTFQWDL